MRSTANRDLRRTTSWDKPTIELPPGWKTSVERLALEINGGKKGMMRYIWAVAADAVLKMNPNDVKAKARDIQRLDADDFGGLINQHCPDPKVAAKLAVPGKPAVEKANRRRTPSTQAQAL